jgi:hypothetical protein
LNDESFLKELGKVARKYHNLQTDATTREVGELSLDVVQTWGETFLPRSQQFPNIPKLYHELRKDGLQFRAQYDETRVPIFTPPPAIPDDPDEALYRSGMLQRPPGGGGMGESGDIDADLAAAMALSLAESGPPAQNVREAFGVSNQSAAAPAPVSSRSRTKSMETIMGCQSSVGILKEIILASSNTSDLAGNDIADVVASQLRSQQSVLMRNIEEALGSDGEVRCRSFINDMHHIYFMFYICHIIAYFLRVWRCYSS